MIDYKLSPLIRSFRKTQLAGIHRTRSNIQQGRKKTQASLMNLLRALYSLRASGGLIRRPRGRDGPDVRRRRVGARGHDLHAGGARRDVCVHVHRSPVAKLFVPHFGCSVNTELLLNDRFAVGEREAMVHVYLPRIGTLRKHKKEHEDSNRHVVNAQSRRERTRRNGPALPPKLLSGERHLFDTVQAHGVPTARIPQFCLRRVRAGGLIWVKVFTSLDSHECPLEKLDHCDERCMERQPACVAGRGCHQRGVNMHARFFDGEEPLVQPARRERAAPDVPLRPTWRPSGWAGWRRPQVLSYMPFGNGSSARARSSRRGRPGRRPSLPIRTPRARAARRSGRARCPARGLLAPHLNRPSPSGRAPEQNTPCPGSGRTSTASAKNSRPRENHLLPRRQNLKRGAPSRPRRGQQSQRRELRRVAAARGVLDLGGRPTSLKARRHHL